MSEFIQRLAAQSVAKTARKWESIRGDRTTTTFFNRGRIVVRKDSDTAIVHKAYAFDLSIANGTIDFVFPSGVFPRRKQKVTVRQAQEGKLSFDNPISIPGALRIWSEAIKARPSLSVRGEHLILSMLEKPIAKAAKAVMLATEEWRQIQPGIYTPERDESWRPVKVERTEMKTEVLVRQTFLGFVSERGPYISSVPIFSFDNKKNSFAYSISGAREKVKRVTVLGNDETGYTLLRDNGHNIFSLFTIGQVRRAAERSKPISRVKQVSRARMLFGS